MKLEIKHDALKKKKIRIGNRVSEIFNMFEAEISRVILYWY